MVRGRLTVMIETLRKPNDNVITGMSLPVLHFNLRADLLFQSLDIH